MKRFKIFILVFTSICLFSLFESCDFPKHYFEPKPDCLNSLDYFNTADPRTPAYQSKALDLLRKHKPHDFRYFFKTFIEEGQNVYMITNFRNMEHCFDVKVLVQNWDKLTGMRRANGKSYPNELYDLEWTIISNNGKQEVLYHDMHDIID